MKEEIEKRIAKLKKEIDEGNYSYGGEDILEEKEENLELLRKFYRAMYPWG